MCSTFSPVRRSSDTSSCRPELLHVCQSPVTLTGHNASNHHDSTTTLGRNALRLWHSGHARRARQWSGLGVGSMWGVRVRTPWSAENARSIRPRSKGLPNGWNFEAALPYLADGAALPQRRVAGLLRCTCIDCFDSCQLPLVRVPIRGDCCSVAIVLKTRKQQWQHVRPSAHRSRIGRAMDCADEIWFAGRASRAELDAKLLAAGPPISPCKSHSVLTVVHSPDFRCAGGHVSDAREREQRRELHVLREV